MDTPDGAVVCRAGDTQCGAQSGTGGASGGSGGAMSTGGTPSTGGAVSSGGVGATGGTASGGGPATGGAATTGGSSGTGATSGGAVATGGASTGGAMATGGAPAGGADASGGVPAAGTTSAGGAPAGGASSDAGTGGVVANGGAGASSGGMAGTNATGGSAGSAGGGMVVDQGGVPLAKPGDSKNGSRQYLNLGDMRLINNKWGSDELGCNTSMSVFVDANKTFGWEFDRGACGGNKEKPDYPEIEFGIHPFGAGNVLATTPSFSSTALLPMQIKNIMSASVVIDSLNINIQRSSTYNLNFEFWLSQRNPLVDTGNPGVHAELITFFAWQDSWACDKSGNVQAGDRSFGLCHQDDAWAGGKWRYFQFRSSSGSNGSFSGRIDVKALIEWLVNNAGYSRDLWVTRLEVGSEIDDNTAGKVTLKNITFEVNGTSKAAQFGQ